MASDDDDEAYARTFPNTYRESQKMQRQLKFNDWLLGGEGLSNAKEWVRTPGPGDTIHRRGGMVKKGSSTVPTPCAHSKVLSCKG